MRVGFIGTGYVGLVSGVMSAAYLNHSVICLDVQADKINLLNNGSLPIYEPELKNFFESARSNLLFTTNYQDLIGCSVIFICVCTPSTIDGSAELKYVKDALLEVVETVDHDTLIVVKSSIPPGTAKQLQTMLQQREFPHEIAVNPEFLREGAAISDFTRPDRIVVGVQTRRAENILRSVYEVLLQNNIPLITTDLASAELIKYTANSFLAVKLSFINEIADLCEKVEGDIEKVTLGIGLDPRIGKLFLKVGPGYGGSCFPKDTLALAIVAQRYDCKLQTLHAAIKANEERYGLMVAKIADIVKDLVNKKLTILGLSFKANTDDIRSSPAVEIIKLLLKRQATIAAYDPAAMNNFRKLNLPVQLEANVKDASSAAEAIIILTEWPEFSKINWRDLKNCVSTKIVIDLRRIADRKQIVENGFQYYTIGEVNAK